MNLKLKAMNIFCFVGVAFLLLSLSTEPAFGHPPIQSQRFSISPADKPGNHLSLDPSPSLYTKFVDNFSNLTLESGWSWIDPSGDSSYSLTANPGFLRLYTPTGGHDLYMNMNAPRVMRSTTGNFTINTRVIIQPQYNYQGAGLLIWFDSNNFIRLERTLVSGVDMWYKVQGHYSGIELPYSNPSVYLRLQRSGNYVAASFSSDNSTWVNLPIIYFPAPNTLQAGLVLINQWQNNPISADFDYFELENSSDPIGYNFLDLPVPYDGTKEAFRRILLNWSDKGRINSWFDHNLPNYSKNNGSGLWIYNAKLTSNEYWVDKLLCFDKHCYDGHNGIDFQKLSNDDPILAAASGKIAEVCRNNPCSRGASYGKYVLIDHENGYASFYAHLSSVRDGLNAGDRVNTRDVIGVVGGTPYWAVHLHFAVYYDKNGDGKWSEKGEEVDPYGWELTEKDPWTLNNGPASTFLWKYPLADKFTAGTSGGSFSSPNGSNNLSIPPSALTSHQELELQDTHPPVGLLSNLWHKVSSFWVKVFEPSATLLAASDNTSFDTQFTFLDDVSIQMSYEDSDIQHIDEDQLTIYHWDEDGSNWNALSTTVLKAQNQAIAETTMSGYFELAGPLLCPADAGLEPDDDYYRARHLESFQALRFDIPEDEDWLWFEASKSKWYTFTLINWFDAEPILEIYQIDGITLAASNEASGKEQIIWQPHSDGTYYVRLRPALGSPTGCDNEFFLGVAEKTAFTDVFPAHYAAPFINRLAEAGITGGCQVDPPKYCPTGSVLRGDMAIFLERGMFYPDNSNSPPPAIGIFEDVPSYYATPWIEALYLHGVTSGCSLVPLRYCPSAKVTRGQMAIFLLKAKFGKEYQPPAYEGIFEDVPSTHFAARWIEQLYREGVTAGCSVTPMKYCPERSVTRADMAVFLVRNFELP
jgi:murein DD-endopeptidase MepM/ murein hydrolase activator NlpD